MIKGSRATIFAPCQALSTRNIDSPSNIDSPLGRPQLAAALSGRSTIARYDADNAVRLLDGWTDAEVPNRTALIATAAAYGGYSLVLLGEGMCSGAIDVGIETPISVARWEEAQLILAEAAVSGGNTQGAVDVINALHADAGLPPYAGGRPEEVLAQVIEERRRELFLEGHRLGDMIRHDLPLFPTAGTPFPVAGGFFGDQVCFPLPAVERLNNPNIPD